MFCRISKNFVVYQFKIRTNNPFIKNSSPGKLVFNDLFYVKPCRRHLQSVIYNFFFSLQLKSHYRCYYFVSNLLIKL